MSDSFEALSLDSAILRTLKHEGYERPTDVQRQAIPYALAGRDVLGIAPTGTGKTAAFTLPILQQLSKGNRGGIRALILTPTRELALQVERMLRTYGHHYSLSSTVVMGGVNANPQIKALKKGIDVLVATPGRLLDLMQQGYVKLDKVEILVLDEADRMLDMGFIHDVRRICTKVPTDRQTLFYSATMPKAVAALAGTLCKNPARIDVDAAPILGSKIHQKVMFVDAREKQALLIHLLLEQRDSKVLIFARTKHRADRIVKKLRQSKINAGAIHSNKTQGARQKALSDFMKGRTRVLVATDIAARGIDVEGITHVINFDLSDEPENHIHRIGRTARAGADGIAISFCDREELKKLAAIEKCVDTAMATDDSHPFHVSTSVKAYREQVTESTKPKKKSRWPMPRRRRSKAPRNSMRIA